MTKVSNKGQGVRPVRTGKRRNREKRREEKKEEKERGKEKERREQSEEGEGWRRRSVPPPTIIKEKR